LDYYEILGIEPNASDEDVKRAYRELARINHPDNYRTSPPGVRLRAEQQMKRINEAYQVLKDPYQRAAYDLSRARQHQFIEKPILQVVPDEIFLDDVDPEGDPLRFSVKVVEIGGPLWSQDIHQLKLALGSPWDEAEFTRVRVVGSQPPFLIEFELNPRSLPWGTRLTGLISIDVKAVV